MIDIATFLGHTNPMTTLSVYSRPSFEQLVGGLQLPWATQKPTEVSTQLLSVLSGGSS